EDGRGEAPSELEGKFEAERLLALDPVRLAQGGEIQGPRLGRPGPRGLAAIADMSAEQDEFPAEGHDLGQDGAGRRVGREDAGPDPGPRRVRRGRDAGVP